MTTSCAAIVLIAAMVCPVSAQSLSDSIESAAAGDATRQPQASSGSMPPGLLWTGVSLLASGGIFLGVGAAEDPTPDTCGYGNTVTVCAPYREVLLTTGGVLAGVGATLLAIGFAKRGAPQITFRPGRFAVEQAVPLDFGIGRLLRRR